MVTSLLSRDAVIRAEVQHAVEKVIAISAQALSPIRIRSFWEPLPQLVVWARWELELQDMHKPSSDHRAQLQGLSIACTKGTLTPPCLLVA